MNKITKITSATEIMEHWPLFYQGMMELNKPKAANRAFSPKQFVNMIYDVVRLTDAFGLVIVSLSKHGIPLGFMIARADPFICERGEVLMVIDYTNEIDSAVPKELQAEVDKWAKAHGYKRMVTLCRRLTKAATRRFKGLGYEYGTALYEKTL